MLRAKCPHYTLLSSASDKSKLFAKSLSKNSNLDDTCTSLLVLPPRANLKLYNIPVTPNLVKMVITNLQRHLVLTLFQWWFQSTVSLNFYTY